MCEGRQTKDGGIVCVWRWGYVITSAVILLVRSAFTMSLATSTLNIVTSLPVVQNGREKKECVRKKGRNAHERKKDRKDHVRNDERCAKERKRERERERYTQERNIERDALERKVGSRTKER